MLQLPQLQRQQARRSQAHSFFNCRVTFWKKGTDVVYVRNNFIIHIVLEDLGGLDITRNKQKLTR